MDAAVLYLTTVRAEFRDIKEQVEKALAQVSDADLTRLIDPDANSIAILIRHMAGNMRSRWTAFLTSDGEKPDCNRDGEFEPTSMRRADLMADWESGWRRLLDTVDALTPSDLTRMVTIRKEQMTVIWAIERQLRHYSAHQGQIVLLAKHFAGPAWTTLSVPKKKAQSS